MAKTDFQSVDDYIASQPEATQAVIERVRGIIRKALPGRQRNDLLPDLPPINCAGRPWSISPGGSSITRSTRHPAFSLGLQGQLAPYELSKGTIRFALGETVPAKLIERIAKFRAKEVAEGTEQKHAQRRSASGLRLPRLEVSSPREPGGPRAA